MVRVIVKVFDLPPLMGEKYQRSGHRGQPEVDINGKKEMYYNCCRYLSLPSHAHSLEAAERMHLRRMYLY